MKGKGLSKKQDLVTRLVHNRRMLGAEKGYPLPNHSTVSRLEAEFPSLCRELAELEMAAYRKRMAHAERLLQRMKTKPGKKAFSSTVLARASMVRHT